MDPHIHVNTISWTQVLLLLQRYFWIQDSVCLFTFVGSWVQTFTGHSCPLFHSIEYNMSGKLIATEWYASNQHGNACRIVAGATTGYVIIHAYLEASEKTLNLQTPYFSQYALIRLLISFYKSTGSVSFARFPCNTMATPAKDREQISCQQESEDDFPVWYWVLFSFFSKQVAYYSDIV